jgi:hypothetical protein
VDARQTAVLPEGDVQVGDVTETDQGFGVISDSVEVDTVGHSALIGMTVRLAA